MLTLQDILTNDAHQSERVTFKLTPEDDSSLQTTSKVMGISQKEFFIYAVTRYYGMTVEELQKHSEFNLENAISKTIVVPKLLLNYFREFSIHRDIILSALINKQKDDDVTRKIALVEEFITYVNAAFQNSSNVFNLIEDLELRSSLQYRIDEGLDRAYNFGNDLLEAIKTGQPFSKIADDY